MPDPDDRRFRPASAPRRVLVTGAASGLGAALARRLEAGGDRVLRTDVRRPGGQAAASTVEPGGWLALDVRSEEDWEGARAWCEEHWGGLDMLVNNAGVASGGRIDVVPLQEWNRVVDVNLMGVVRGCRTFVPGMKRQGSGRLVNIASAAGLIHPPAMSVYNAVKAGVVALSETLAHELAPYGIITSVVCPSFFRTDLASSLSGTDPAVEASARSLIDRARLSADEVAARVVAGVDRGRFLVLPDGEGRVAWAAKRFARGLYDRQLRRVARDLHTRVGEA